VTDRQTRLVLIGLGLVFVAIVVIAFVLAPGGDDAPLPSGLERVSPQPGDAVLPQAGIVVDLAAGYSLDLWVDGLRIPAAQVDYVAATGLYTWEPGPGRSIEEWRPGSHTVRAAWDRLTGLPDPGSFDWEFRVQ